MKTETVEQFLRRGGKVKKIEPQAYEQGKTSRYRLKDLDLGKIIEAEKQRVFSKK